MLATMPGPGRMCFVALVYREISALLQGQQHSCLVMSVQREVWCMVTPLGCCGIDLPFLVLPFVLIAEPKVASSLWIPCLSSRMQLLKTSLPSFLPLWAAPRSVGMLFEFLRLPFISLTRVLAIASWFSVG